MSSTLSGGVNFKIDVRDQGLVESLTYADKYNAELLAIDKNIQKLAKDRDHFRAKKIKGAAKATAEINALLRKRIPIQKGLNRETEKGAAATAKDNAANVRALHDLFRTKKLLLKLEEEFEARRKASAVAAKRQSIANSKRMKAAYHQEQLRRSALAREYALRHKLHTLSKRKLAAFAQLHAKELKHSSFTIAQLNKVIAKEKELAAVRKREAKQGRDRVTKLLRAYATFHIAKAAAMSFFSAVKEGAESLALDETLGRSIEGYAEVFEEAKKLTRGMTNDMALKKSLALMTSFGMEAEKIPKLLELSQKAALRTGQSAEYMADSLARGLSRVSPLILDNLGVQVSVKDATEQWRIETGNLTGEMSKVNRQIAFQNAAIKALDKTTKDVDLDNTLIAPVKRAGVAFDNLLLKAKEVIAEKLSPILEGWQYIFSNDVEQGIMQIDAFGRRAAESLAKIKGGQSVWEGFSLKRQLAYAESLIKTASAMRTMARTYDDFAYLYNEGTDEQAASLHKFTDEVETWVQEVTALTQKFAAKAGVEDDKAEERARKAIQHIIRLRLERARNGEELSLNYGTMRLIWNSVIEQAQAEHKIQKERTDAMNALRKANAEWLEQMKEARILQQASWDGADERERQVILMDDRRKSALASINSLWEQITDSETDAGRLVALRESYGLAVAQSKEYETRYQIIKTIGKAEDNIASRQGEANNVFKGFSAKQLDSLEARIVGEAHLLEIQITRINLMKSLGGGWALFGSLQQIDEMKERLNNQAQILREIEEARSRLKKSRGGSSSTNGKNDDDWQRKAAKALWEANLKARKETEAYTNALHAFEKSIHTSLSPMSDLEKHLSAIAEHKKNGMYATEADYQQARRIAKEEAIDRRALLDDLDELKKNASIVAEKLYNMSQVGQGLIGDDWLGGFSAMAEGINLVTDAIVTMGQEGKKAGIGDMYLAALPALQKFTKSFIKEQRLQAGILAIMEAAAAWASWPNPALVASHSTAAAMYAAVALGAVKLPSKGGKESSPKGAKSSTGKEAPLHIHINGPVMADEAEKGALLMAAIDEARAQGRA